MKVVVPPNPSWSAPGPATPKARSRTWSSRATPSEYLDDAILPALFEGLDHAFPEFGWVRTADGWEATNREFTKAKFGVRADRVICKRPHGFFVYGGTSTLPKGTSQAWMAYLSGGRHPSGAEWWTCFERLAQLAGVGIDWVTKGAPYEPPAVFKRQPLFEAFYQYCRNALQDPGFPHGRDHLVNERKLPEELLKVVDLGYLPGLEFMGKALEEEGYTETEIVDAGLWRRSFAGRIIGAIRDPQERIVDFWARRIDGVEDHKYDRLDGKYTLPLDQQPLYGIDKVDLGKPVVLVEGYPDVAILQARGYTQTLAIGGLGAKLTAPRWEWLARQGITQVTLIGDNDPKPDGTWPGLEGVESAVRQSLAAKTCPVISVVHPRHLGTGIKDPEELCRGAGVEGLQALVKEHSVHALRFLALHLMEGITTDSPTDAEIARVLLEAGKITSQVTRTAQLLDLDAFLLEPLRAGLKLSPEAFKSHLARLQTEVERKSRSDQLREAVGTHRVALNELGDDQAADLILETSGRIRQLQLVRTARPIRSVADELPLIEAELERYRGMERLGLECRLLPSLDQKLMGLRGLLLLAAAPGTGKTTLATSIGWSIATNDSEAGFVFLSLEMPLRDTVNRLRCHVGRLPYRQLVLGDPGVGHSELFKADLAMVDQEVARVGSRVLILDGTNFPDPTLEGLLHQIELFKQATGVKKVFVLVDYLQVWPIPESVETRSELDEDKWRIGLMKDLRDSMSRDDAVMVISEARKPSGTSGDKWGGSMADVMGTARLSYTPDFILLLQPLSDWEHAKRFGLTRVHGTAEAIDDTRLKAHLRQLQEEGKSLNYLHIAKARDGGSRGRLELTYLFRKSTFLEGLRKGDGVPEASEVWQAC